MNTQDNYLVRQEEKNLARLFRPKINKFQELLVINADQEESSLLTDFCVSSLTARPYKLFMYAQDDSRLVDSNSWGKCFPYDQLVYHCYRANRKYLVILFNNRTLDQDIVRDELKHIQELLLQNRGSQLIVASESYLDLLGKTSYFQYSEREYALALQETPSTSAETRALANDALCQQMYERRLNVSVINYANLFGPSIGQQHSTPLTQICSDVAKKHTIEFDPDEDDSDISYTYISDFLQAISSLASQRMRFSTFNLASFHSTRHRIRSLLLDICPDYALDTHGKVISPHVTRYSMLQSMRIRRYARRTGLPTFTEALDRTVHSFFTNTELDKTAETKYNEEFRGKIDEIRRLETDVLLEIHKICEKHDLKYFLTAGTLLGAVRHQGFIPWDDDADVGFSRKDYEVFRRVAPKELPENYYYQNTQNPDESHYILDKIRVKDTVLSTSWTDMFRYPTGVYVDIYVYDKTSNFKTFQNAHIRLLKWVYSALTLRWRNRLRRNQKHKRLSKLMLPVLRLLPHDFFFDIYERILKLYAHKETNRYIIDGVGTNLKRGAFPADWLLGDRVLRRFNGHDFYVPEKYDAFLTAWYGAHYMDLLPLSDRHTHRYTDIDLGANLSDS